MQEITVRVHIKINQLTGVFIGTCPDFPMIVETGTDMAEVAIQTQKAAMQTVHEKGLVDERYDLKVSVETSFEYV